MKKFELIAPCHFGLEAVLKKEIMDLQLEAQIELDSTFTAGEYNLLFNVSDEISKQTKSILIPFTLEN